MSDSDLLLHGLGYALAYATLMSAILAGSFKLLDVITPGHHIGQRKHEGSHSAGLVSAAWFISQGAIMATAIWTNGDSSLGWALLNTVAFSVVGALVLAVTFFIHDKMTPGSLSEEICKIGPISPLAMSTSGSLIAMSAIVCASIA